MGSPTRFVVRWLVLVFVCGLCGVPRFRDGQDRPLREVGVLYIV